MSRSSGGIVSVIILNWNGWQDTVECLSSLFQSTGLAFRVIVCDNASRDDSLHKITEWARCNLTSAELECLSRADVLGGASAAARTKLVVVDNGANLGFAGGNNIGLRLALRDPDCDYVWLLNNDTVVEPDALAKAVAHAESNLGIGICGSTLVYYRERSQVQAFGGAHYSRISGRSVHVGAFSSLVDVPRNPGEVEAGLSYVVGAAMLVRRGFVEQVGLMREDYFLYFEENDWATRGRGGFRLGYAPQSIVYHKEGASIGTSSNGGSALSVYFLYRNRLKFSWRFYPLWVPTVLMFCMLDIAKLVLRRRWLLARAALLGVLQIPRSAMVFKA